MTTPDFSSLALPPSVFVDFCIIPIGTNNPSVSKEVAAVQELLKSTGLNYTMHSAGTTIEGGTWENTMRVIGQAHALLHQNGAARVHTTMRVGTRTDKDECGEDKVKKVEQILAGRKS